jgi:creatinine amidohydrolase
VAPIRFAELTTLQADALLRSDRTPVLLLAVAAVEPHGPHAPLGTDCMIASGICDRAARALEHDPEVRALTLEPLAYGVTRYAASFRGTVGIAPATLRALLLDLLRSLIADGFRHVVIVNHHFEPEHVQTLREVERTLCAEGGLVALLDLTRRSLAQRLTDEFRSGSSHAGRYETSLVLADRPDLIDAELMQSLPELDVPMPAEIAAGHRDFLAMGMHDAYCGAPARATAREGEESFEALAQMVVELARELAQGQPPS